MDEEEVHELADTWTYRVKLNKTNASWSVDCQDVFEFDTVETFWQLWNNTLGHKEGQFDKSEILCTVHSFFRDGIKPAWEDPANKYGCSMHFYFEDAIFTAECIALLLIGNELNNQESFINGCTFDVKPPRFKNAPNKWKLSIWLGQNQEKSSFVIYDIKNWLCTELPESQHEHIMNCRIDNHTEK
jgi:hypothetical protein